MREVVARLFSRQNPLRDAKNCITRIISRYDVSRISYQEGIEANRRSRDERHVALGVWLFPVSEDCPSGSFVVDQGVQGVTYDFRSEGLGVMTPVQLEHERLVVATPDETGRWRFIETEVRHNTLKPGEWYMLGLQVIRLIDLEGDQAVLFRKHTNKVGAESPN